ncbi:MAG: adenylate/guanylate cyclase domain-containing protein, partial [Bacteroidota bacterium]
MEDALTHSSLYFEQGFYHKASDLAEKAYDAARKADLNEYMAKALNKQGKAQAKIPNSKPAVKNRAFKNFQESNRLTTELDLRLDNLQQMKELAIILEKRKELDKILKDIAVLTGEISPGQAVTSAEGGKKATNEQLQQTLQENEKLNAELKSTHQYSEKLKKNQQIMQQMVRQQSATIQNMTAEQVKYALQISMQKQVLDSLTYAGMLDSMELVNQKMIVEQKEAQLREKEAEIQLKKSQRNLLLAAVGFVLLLAAGLFNRYQVTSKHNAVLAEKNNIIEEERKRSEELLLNILPAAVAEELKRKNEVVARHYKNATVLFTDFEGFSSISKLLSAEKLVSDLNYAIKKFDEIIGRNGLEKIKTIGD